MQKSKNKEIILINLIDLINVQKKKCPMSEIILLGIGHLRIGI